MVMARPSKYTQELIDQLTGYIADGLTVRDACFGAGISEDTFWRWNREKLEFAEAIKKATSTQKWSSEALMRTSEYRRYIRRTHICPKKRLDDQNPTCTHLHTRMPQKQALEASDDISQNVFHHQTKATPDLLPIRSEPPTSIFGELIPSGPYYNQITNKVE